MFEVIYAREQDESKQITKGGEAGALGRRSQAHIALTAMIIWSAASWERLQTGTRSTGVKLALEKRSRVSESATRHGAPAGATEEILPCHTLAF